MKYLLAVLSGGLLALAFPPVPFYLFAFIGFIPLLFLFVVDENPRRPFLMVYITFLVYHTGVNWWIGSWQADKDPFLIASGVGLSIIHPFFFMVPFAIFLKIYRSLGRKTALWSFPFVWTAFEWAHSLTEFSYPWLTVGNTQIYNLYWVQFIDLTGVWGASFLIVLANVILLNWMIKIREGKKMLNLSYISAIAAVFVIPIAYGLVRTTEFEHKELLENNKSIRIGLIQPSINPWRKWEDGAYEQVLLHMKLQDSLEKAVGGIDFGIWAETTIMYINENLNFGKDYNLLSRWVNRTGIPFMSGFAHYVMFDNADATVTAKPWPFDSTKLYESYNTALLLHPDSIPAQTYHKMKLTPFAERIPHQEQFGFVQKFVSWGVGVSSWGIGKEQHPLRLYTKGETFGIAPVICIESIYPGFVSEFSNLGAGIYTVITNDAWYDYTSGPEQHYQIAALRAIETRRYIARCANSGVTGFIKPTGKSLLRAPQYKRTAIAASIPEINELSFYARMGDWLPLACSFVTLFYFIWGYFRK